MSSTIGKQLELAVFGESHGAAIGCVINGLPAGEPLDEAQILAQMARRAPGTDKTSTTRKESDTPEIVSGILDGRTTGAPLAMIIRNDNQRSGDYANLARLPRPGHADYTGYVRYSGFNDIRGGGHFSGRLTARVRRRGMPPDPAPPPGDRGRAYPAHCERGGRPAGSGERIGRNARGARRAPVRAAQP